MQFGNNINFKICVHYDKKSSKIPKGGNQNPYIEEEQTTQWPKEKVQKDKQRSTKHTYKTKDRGTRTPLKTGGELFLKLYASHRVHDTYEVGLMKECG